ncbi:MAG: alkaline phosphatase [Ignavibacterium sp.]
MKKKILNFVWIYFLVIFQLVYSQNEIPKNIIIMIGDGMGLNYISTSIIQDKNSPFRKFSFVGLSNTCSADKLITDSAAGATAISTGYKTNNKFIGVSPDEKNLTTIFDIAKKLNKSNGLVATSSITNATPACFYGKTNDRKNETLIAEQLLSSNVDIAIAGGTKFFLPKTNNGIREDNRNLISELKEKNFTVETEYNSLIKVNDNKKLVALLAEEGIPPANNRNYSLKDLTKIAIEKLNKNENGFVLMIEGSQIDWAGHANDQNYLLSEVKDFTDAINYILDFAKENNNTLVVVTADHETGAMSIIDGEKNGNNLKLNFGSKNHSAGLVGVFAYGPSAINFSGIYENSELGRKLFHLLEPNYNF